MLKWQQMQSSFGLRGGNSSFFVALWLMWTVLVIRSRFHYSGGREVKVEGIDLLWGLNCDRCTFSDSGKDFGWISGASWPIWIVLGVKSPILYLLGGMKMGCGAREVKLEDVELLWG